MLSQIFKKKKIQKEELVKVGVVSALVEILYIVLVGSFMMTTEALFPADSSSLIMGIASVLMLLVLSVTVSAVLMLGMPLYLTLQKQYKEALVVVGSSILTLVTIFVLIILGEIFIY